jgi:hypothetical protein
MAKVKYILFIIIVLSFPVNIFSQNDSIRYVAAQKQNELTENSFIDFVTIYPVPVTDNSFTIKSNKEISMLKITNIIGQDIYRIKYASPQNFAKIILNNPRRGMYLVVILFSDNTRIVKKVMVESTD